MPFRRLPNVVVHRYQIYDNDLIDIDKEYIDLGVRENWLTLHKIVERKGLYTYIYIYPFSGHCE